MPERIYAGFWRRLIAVILDQIILIVARFFIYGALGLMVYAMLYLFDVRDHHTLIFSIGGGVLTLVDMWLTWIYFAMMESSSLQGSLGKLALGIRVYHVDNRPLKFEEATVRYFAKILSAASLSVGYLLAAFSSKKQALHDFVAHAVLVVERG